MARRSRHAAYHALENAGPWVEGSAHGYHIAENCAVLHHSGFLHLPGGKYGHGHKHCLFCFEDIPFHREYCPWHDLFQAYWPDVDPMEIEKWYDKSVRIENSKDCSAELCFKDTEVKQ